MTEKIYTTSSLKQHFNYLFARHLSNIGLPYNYSFLQQIIILGMANDEIRAKVLEKLDKLQKEGIIKDKNAVLQSFRTYKGLYFQTSFLLEALKKKIDDKGIESDREKSFRKEINRTIREINSQLPIINDYLMILFTLVVEDSDLCHSVAPREEILFPEKAFNKDQHKENKELKL